MTTAQPASVPALALRLLATALRHGVRAPAYRRLHACYHVRRVDRLLDLASRQVVAVGHDAWRADAFRTAGARCLVVEPADARGASAEGERVIADGYWLPVRDGAADLAYCDAAFPRAPDAVGVLDELARITRVGGLVCLSLTGARRLVVRHLRHRSDLTLLTRLATVPRPRRRAELVLRRTA
ncbi:SAM-dependent methyltransferase [Streptacidiphilus sp. MAP12-33]|uniref:methyltransferase domain-containing protein n=1 Tax=Streptacidiphilus sp. MAP12-33 TaxID=3156266 RepID=UPI003515704A